MRRKKSCTVKCFYACESLGELTILYDENNNIIYRTIGVAEPQEIWYEYDENNNLIHERDSEGKETWYEYNENNDVVRVVDSEGMEYEYEYEYESDDEKENNTQK